MTTSEPRISELWFRICDTFGDRYGTPLPHAILELGDPKRGWHIRLNATERKTKGIEPFFAEITWGGFPAGYVGPHDGVMAAGTAANEETLIAALPSLPLRP